jgi:hypothetical protein
MTPPTDAAGLLALADRCEAATGPDREIDCDIQEIVRSSSSSEWEAQSMYERTLRKRYTGSIDTAMGLLDKFGILISLSDIGADGLPMARVGRPDLQDAPVFVGISSSIGRDATSVSGLALALCAAALRARATFIESQPND